MSLGSGALPYRRWRRCSGWLVLLLVLCSASPVTLTLLVPRLAHAQTRRRTPRAIRALAACLFRQARKALGKGENAKAAALFERLKRLRRSDRVYLGLGLAYLRLGKTEQAVAAFDQIRPATRRSLAKKSLVRGQRLLKAKKTAAAVQELRLSQRLDPQLATRLALARALELAGNFKDAEAIYADLLSRRTAEAEALKTALARVKARGEKAEHAAATPESQPAASDDFDMGSGKESGGSDDLFDLGEDVAAPPPPSPVGPWSLTGFTRSDWALWTERIGENSWAKGRQNLDLVLRYKRSWLRVLLSLHGEYDLAYRASGYDYDEPTLDAYEWKVDTREAMAVASFGEADITVGRQIVAWGVGDAVSPLDLVNPRDGREPGLSDVADIRLAVLASRFGWFRKNNRLEFMVVHEAEFGYLPPPRSPYSAFNELLFSNPDLALALQDKTISFRHLQPRFHLNQQQVFVRWKYAGEGIDLGLCMAYLLDRNGIVRLDPQRWFTSTDPEQTIDMSHKMYKVFGTSGAWPVWQLLVKWELVAEIEKEMNTLSYAPDGSMVIGNGKGHLVSMMLGLTWSGIRNLSLGVETLKAMVIDKPGELLVDATAPVLALRASYSLLDGKLKLLAASSMIGWRLEQGWLFRTEATYSIVDTVKATLGYISYHPGDEFGPFYGFTEHDRAFARLRWDFQIL